MDISREARPNPQALREGHDRLRETDSRVRAREVAERLGVSEAELVAARCGEAAIRLDGRRRELLESLPALGRVMTLTRNDFAVHETVGRFETIEASDFGALVTGDEIDLRIRWDGWRFGYAVTDRGPSAVRRSLQFFDGAGVAVFKLHVRDETDLAAYEALVDRHRADDQSPGQGVATAEPPRPVRSDADIDIAALRERWRAMQDVHEFAMLLRDLDVRRVQAFRLIGPEFAERVPPSSFVETLQQAAASGLSIMVFVPSPGVVQIHTGPVATLKRVGPWFNVLDPGFNLHLRDEGIASAWVVRKPTREGIVSSLEIFDADDRQIAWLFGQRDRGMPEREEWRNLLAGLSRAAGTA